MSHEAAAALHGLATFAPGPVVVTVPHGRHRCPGLAVVHQSGRLPSDHLAVVRGLPVTTVERALVDLAAVCRRARVEHVLDDAVAARLTTVERVCACFDVASPGRPGTALMRSVLGERQPGDVPPASRLEALLLRVLKEGGLPRPVLQFPHPGRLPVEGRVDATYPEGKLSIEVDSRRWHSRRTRPSTAGATRRRWRRGTGRSGSATRSPPFVPSGSATSWPEPGRRRRERGVGARGPPVRWAWLSNGRAAVSGRRRGGRGRR